MSGAGTPTTNTPLDGTGLKVTIVAGRWHDRIAEGLLAGARSALAEAKVDVTEIRVPGSFELPVVCRAALEAGADAVVALGVIIRGGTPHFEYVSDAATSGDRSTAARPISSRGLAMTRSRLVRSFTSRVS